MNNDPFKEYIKESEPDKRDKGYAWHTAIGLQAVDGLKTSEYLVHTAVRNIEGEISFEEANALLQSYYEENPACDADDRTEEADKVSARIAALLTEKAFSFTPNEYLSIHRKLFTGIYSHAGHIRDYNITKKEWVLAVFISKLWQIHVFGEGNTRTTAVFFIKYLRALGFDVTNDIFAENAWYFRNSLVRANYNDLKNGIYETTEFLELFLRNLLFNENHPLHNRALHIRGTFKMSEKVNIEERKANIEREKTNIENSFTVKSASHVCKLLDQFGFQTIFGRSNVQEILGLKPTRSTALLKEMAEKRFIEPVTGLGKGKYRFRQ